MKRISLFLLLMLLTTIFFTACVKDRNVGTDFSNTDAVLELRTPVINMAGLSFFGNAVIGNLADTVQFYVNLASENTINQDINVTLGVDNNRLDAFNADVNNVVKYELLPDSDYTILKTSGTIKAGQRVDSFQVVFYKDKISPTSNYMLPLAILDGDGILISQNQGVIWFHAIGNPIAGVYEEEWLRWNALDTSGDPTYDLDLGPVGFAPTDPTTIEVASQGTGDIDIITFENNGGSLSGFDVAFDPAQIAGLGITVTFGPLIPVADPVNGIYVVYFEYNNSLGDHRCIKNIYRKL